jgi:hypothetical protein
MSNGQVILGDVLAPATWDTVPDGCVDLVFGSPPYEDARTYGIDFSLKGQDWVDWMVDAFRISLQHCRGLVAFVLEGRTRKFRWSSTPALLMADLHRAGIHLRKPPAFRRVGIPGSGGPDWLRNDYEFIVCATNGGKLPWSDNTALGHPPKWAPGGEMSHRVSDGTRINQWGHPLNSGATTVRGDGTVRSHGRRPSRREHTKRTPDRDMETQSYVVPTKANPGNVLAYNVGGGLMGSKLAHENEAPFPESLADFFVRSFCPPEGLVCDPFSGSGTTGAASLLAGRDFVGFDIRQSQVELSQKRLAETVDRIGKAKKPSTYTVADVPPDATLFTKGDE